jgi:signal transduction histidine kinase/ActR/RegA family two-component response regulator
MITAQSSLLPNQTSGILLLVEPLSLAICDVSPPTLELLGYRLDELLGRPITEIECSLAAACFWDEVLQGGPIGLNDPECVYRCASGKVLLTSRTVSRALGDGAGLLVIQAEPLGSGRRNEDEFASTASLLRATLEATTDGVLLIDRTGRIANMNRRFALVWGVPDALLVAHDDDAIFAFMAGQLADHDASPWRLADFAPDSDEETFDVLCLTDRRFIEWKSMPARHGSRILGRVFFFTDVTERRQSDAARTALEAQLRESQKMDAIGKLAGGIAHDFNNILATILGNTELARQDMGANPQALRSLAEIHKAASRARDLVQQILSFSRRQPTERIPLALAPVIEESARLLRATVPARLALEVRCAKDVPAVLADATQIKQVLINLVTNAMQAMHGRPGSILIGLDTVLFDAALADAIPALQALLAKHAGRMVRLTVSDNGPGMDAATQERIFEPFYTTKPVGEGTGLGLSVVHGIVTAHEGAIMVQSQPDKGSIFTIYLPVAETEVSVGVAGLSVGSPPATPPGNSGQRILYLDDDESLVLLVKRLLERQGVHVRGFSNQDDALDALRADPTRFDLVVTDYNMPGLSGLDVAREVRTIRDDLPVAVASGFIDEELQAQAGRSGVRELIFKADAAEDLCQALVRLLRTIKQESNHSFLPTQSYP